MGLHYKPTTGISSPYTSTARTTVIDNRKCKEYIFTKWREGDTRSAAALWTEARATYTNAATTISDTYDNPPIQDTQVT